MWLIQLSTRRAESFLAFLRVRIQCLVMGIVLLHATLFGSSIYLREKTLLFRLEQIAKLRWDLQRFSEEAGRLRTDLSLPEEDRELLAQAQKLYAQASNHYRLAVDAHRKAGEINTFLARNGRH